jgi:putative glutathione S-transferase
MGQLVDGAWVKGDVATLKGGAFERQASTFRSWVTADGRPGPSGEGGFPADAGRYHLYVSLACPWAHRTLVVRALKGLEALIGVSVVHPDMGDEGWNFDASFPGATGDRLMGLRRLYEVYQRADLRATTKVTVPVLWDGERGTVVSNESSEIIRMMTAAWDRITGNDLDLWPEGSRNEIEAVNVRVYDTLNNGVYRAGFATSQEAYDAAVHPLFDTLDWLETRLSGQRWLVGGRLTEADVRLWTTLIRFDTVYHGHFKCNRRKLVEYPALWGFTRDLYQVPGVAGTVDLAQIARHYHWSHPGVNPRRIVPIGPVLDLEAPHGRDALP